MTLFKRLNPIALSALILIGGLTMSPVQAGNQTAATQKVAATEAKAAPAATEPAQTVTPLELVKSPAQYLDKNVQFEGTFNRFADIALDYNKAFRDSREYVSLLVLRPNTSQHSIPLSELKLFFPREKSDSVSELETGDKVRISGKVFSAQLDEPWMDVTQIEILEKTKNSTKPAVTH